MQGVALVFATQTAFVYILGIVLEPILLPVDFQVSVKFPTDMIEDSLALCVYSFGVLFSLCAVTLPLWQKGYQVCMEAAGRKGITMSLLATFMELMYQTSQAGTIMFIFAPLWHILQEHFGLGVHAIHVMFCAVEIVVINYLAQFKFCIVHQLLHEIKPLYAMAHMEHHVNKGVHPTTSAVGLWEIWVFGGGITFTSLYGLVAIPYAGLQCTYMGFNLIIHTMWPAPSLLQWHTLHHTVLADIYSGNIPSPYDKENSRTFKKLNKTLQMTSPFVRYEFLTDLGGFILVLILGAFFHYGLGVGAGHADWSQAEWTYNVP